MPRTKPTPRKKTGLPPGTLVYTGSKPDALSQFRLIAYNEEQVFRSDFTRFDELKIHIKPEFVNWVDVVGLADVSSVERLGTFFNLHALTLEDALNVASMPKCEGFANYLVVSFKLLQIRDNTLHEEHWTAVLGDRFLLTFQESEGDIFDDLRTRITLEGTRLRQLGADYLLCRLIDITVDYYYLYLDSLFEQCGVLEEQLIAQPNKEFTPRILELRKGVMRIRRAAYPLRDAMLELRKNGQTLIQPETSQYFNDVIDHLNHIGQGIGEAEEMLRGCMDMQAANNTNNLNQVMKVLTVVSTVFIPLTFIVGVYGMNFEFMPELGWKLGYPMVWLTMLGVAGLMIWYFRKKGWF